MREPTAGDTTGDSSIEQQRRRPPAPLAGPRPLIVALPPMRSLVNAARIVRAAGSCGVTRVVLCGHAKLDPKITRDSLDFVQLERHRTLAPALKQFKEQGYQLVGLEQTNRSVSLHQHPFARQTVLVVGHERLGMTDDMLRLLDVAVEIPVYGRPLSYNVATAAAMAMYEYCRQFPQG